MYKILALVLLMLSSTTFASDRISVSLGFGYQPTVVREYVQVQAGYWQETRIPATYSVTYINGVRYETLVTPERCERVWISPRYQLVERPVYCSQPVVVYPRPSYYCPPPVTHFHFGYRSR